MKLRKSIILIVATCFGLLLTFLLISTRHLTYAKFNDLEDNHIRANLRRGINAISAITANLNLLASDWAYWDDTYIFLKDGNQGYINSNLPVETFEAQQNQLVVFFNREQKLVWGKYLPPKGKDLVQLPNELTKIFQEMLTNPQINRDGSGFSGLVSLPQGLYSIAGKAVLTSNHQGPSTGWLIMGKALDGEVIEELQVRTELRLDLRPITSTAPPTPPPALAIFGQTKPAHPIIEKLPASISCTGEIDGILAQPVALLNVSDSREFYNSGVAAANQLLTIILATGALAASLLFWLLERKVLLPIDHLNTQVTAVDKGDPADFALLSGQDEIADLSRSIRDMLGKISQNFAELQAMQQSLIDSEERYKSLFMSTGNPCVVVGEDLRIQLANQEFRKRMKIPTDVVIEGKSWPDFFPPDDAERMGQWQILRRRNSSLAPRSFETRYKDYNGRIRYAILTVALIPGTSNSSCSLLDITDHKKAEQELIQKAFYDSLTGLPNRQLFYDRLQHTIEKTNRSHGSIGVFLLDIDDFKNVNDTLGHQAGDKILQEIALRISQCTRQSDTLARLGGDEFALIVQEPKDITVLCQVADKIIAAFGSPYLIEDTEFYLGVSVGITIFPEAGNNPEVLLKNADLAMYQSKAKGKNRYVVFTDTLSDHAQQRIRLDKNIRQALTSDGFEVYYQPKVNLEDGRVYGMEALARGKSPNGEIIPPAEFIPFAEANGLIVPIDLVILEKACRQTAQWIEGGCDQLVISVNISTRHFRQSDFVEQIENILTKTGLPASCLELEVTETAMMKDFDQAISSLKRFRAMGISISLDDFGTGYSSLNYLHNLPIQTLKIDKIFIDRIGSTEANTLELVKIIISLAETMKVEVVAEGVETPEQRRILRTIGCLKAQGYLFSKPLPCHSFENLLSVGKGKIVLPGQPVVD